jgi:hypothetical protein
MTAIAVLNTYPIEPSEKTLILVSVSALLNKKIMAEEMNPSLSFCRMKEGIEMELEQDDLEAEVMVDIVELEGKNNTLCLQEKTEELTFEEKATKL